MIYGFREVFLFLILHVYPQLIQIFLSNVCILNEQEKRIFPMQYISEKILESLNHLFIDSFSEYVLLSSVY